MGHTEQKIHVLEKEIHSLKSENTTLKQKLSGQKVPLSDDAIDGISWVIFISVICFGIIFYLAGMPS